MKRLSIFIYITVSTCYAQDSLLVQGYINQYKNIAIAEMQRSGVPAAITIAQGIHESAAGKSELVLSSNNHFGIKCKTTWLGPKVFHDDDARGECFRAYTSAEDSYKDHSDFLASNQRYRFLFNYDPLDYQNWAKGLKIAGYATNPRYPQILIATIEKYKLNDISLMALGKLPTTNDAAFAVSVEKTAPILTKKPVPAPAANPYPAGIFTINNCKVIFAPKGTSLLALAIQHRVSLSNLISWNDMDEIEITPANQLIFLERKQKKGDKQYHQVLPGETLWAISQAEGIRVSNLMQFNLLSFNDKPLIDEMLNLQAYAIRAPKVVR